MRDSMDQRSRGDTNTSPIAPFLLLQLISSPRRLTPHGLLPNDILVLLRGQLDLNFPHPYYHLPYHYFVAPALGPLNAPDYDVPRSGRAHTHPYRNIRARQVRARGID
ncbi:unnamed protein product [Cyclocybe aegerita]|uniref:Uncharacterized protein n=1 Tax=Cyclocybe aegerita TaxID=1973307 RepID=A0A8S0VSD6_CYCAE|nr:unnamed protein product [Cyclocybe aegerita]